MRVVYGHLPIVVWAALLPAACLPADAAKDLLKVSGVRGGVVMHVGCGNGQRTAALGKPLRGRLLNVKSPRA